MDESGLLLLLLLLFLGGKGGGVFFSSSSPWMHGFLCLLVVSQASQHLRSYHRQTTCNLSFGLQYDSIMSAGHRFRHNLQHGQGSRPLGYAAGGGEGRMLLLLSVVVVLLCV